VAFTPSIVETRRDRPRGWRASPRRPPPPRIDRSPARLRRVLRWTPEHGNKVDRRDRDRNRRSHSGDRL